MPRLEYLIPIGLLKKTRKFIPGHFSFTKVIADVLKQLNVPFQDECCDNLNNPSPVRFNETTQKLQYHDGDSWVDVPASALV